MFTKRILFNRANKHGRHFEQVEICKQLWLPWIICELADINF